MVWHTKEKREAQKRDLVRKRSVLILAAVAVFGALSVWRQQNYFQQNFLPSNLSHASYSWIWQDEADTKTSEQDLGLFLGEGTYSEWLLNHTANLSHQNGENKTVPFNLKYKAVAGLGHQLQRMANAYHLAALYGIPYLFAATPWQCGGEIYDRLLGKGRLLVVPNKELHPQLDYNESKLHLPKGWPELKGITYVPNNSTQNEYYRVEIINEVPGYTRAAPKNLKNYLEHDLYGREETDAHFYRQLMMYFENEHRARIQEIVNQTKFDQHTVLGLHVRAGNGEKGQFARHRQVTNLDLWLQNVGQLFCEYSMEYSHLLEEYPLMIYLGTDTSSVIDQLQSILKNLTISHNCSEIPVVTTEQERMEAGTGVSYGPQGVGGKDSELCYERWVSMLLDMYFISRSNTVVAGQYSSFSKAAPFTLATRKAQFYKTNPDAPRARPFSNFYCEVGDTGKRLDCYDSYASMHQAHPAFTFGDTSEPMQAIYGGSAYRIPVERNITADNWNKLFEKSPLTFQDGSVTLD